MKISVITVTRNSEKTLQDCISSVAKQSYKNFEHIIIDGASSDETLKLLKKNSNYISLVLSEPDKGIYDAMNKGINLANGDIIGFLNSDDFYSSNFVLSSVAKIFEEKSFIEATYSDLIYVDKVNPSRIIRYWKSSQFNSGLFSKGWSPPHPTFFVRKSVYKLYGNFDLNYFIASDIELMMRFLEVHKISSHYVPEIWVNMREGGLSNNSLLTILTQNIEVLRALKKHGLQANFLFFFVSKLLIRIKQFFWKFI